MAKVIAEICELEDVRAHPNADRLELASIKGWQVCIPKGKYKTGDSITYLQVDCLVPEEWAEKWGITNYLGKQKNNEPGLRVKCVRLQGEPSFGVVLDNFNDLPLGTDVSELYGITKYEPPVKFDSEDQEKNHPLFEGYTDIENLRNFPEVFIPEELVYIFEKCHGMNTRLAMIEGEWMAGTHHTRRKFNETGKVWFPYRNENVRKLIEHFAKDHQQVLLFGELVGAGIQHLHYGFKKDPGYFFFDLLLDGKYMNPFNFMEACAEFNVPRVPLLYHGPFDMEKVKELASGNTALDDTLLNDSQKTGWTRPDHIKEGVVVKPKREGQDPRVGRRVLKYISDDYLLSKNKSDNK
jgi:RNA ligase (TIGR02306 family)